MYWPVSILAILLPIITRRQTPVAPQYFTVVCDPLTVQRSDPIVASGNVFGHVHAVVGGTAFNRSESNDQAKHAMSTTCNKLLDRSNYWVPQLYHQSKDGNFTLVPLEKAAIYYQNHACNYTLNATSCDCSTFVLAPPPGLRMLAGNMTQRMNPTADPNQNPVTHRCLPNDGGADIQTNHLPTTTCYLLRSQVYFLSCWDGRDDTPIHQDHMAYPALGNAVNFNVGICPSSHPIAIFSIFYEFFFRTDIISSADFNQWVYSQGDPTGYGLHGDLINGWTDQDRLQRAMLTCTAVGVGDDDPNCSLRVNGTIGIFQPQELDTPAPADSEILLTGSSATLPGVNPVTGMLYPGSS